MPTSTVETGFSIPAHRGLDSCPAHQPCSTTDSPAGSATARQEARAPCRSKTENSRSSSPASRLCSRLSRSSNRENVACEASASSAAPTPARSFAAIASTGSSCSRAASLWSPQPWAIIATLVRNSDGRLWVTRRGSRGSSNCATGGSISAVRSSVSRRSRDPASPVSFSGRASARTNPSHSGRKSSAEWRKRGTFGSIGRSGGRHQPSAFELQQGRRNQRCVAARARVTMEMPNPEQHPVLVR